MSNTTIDMDNIHEARRILWELRLSFANGDMTRARREAKSGKTLLIAQTSLGTLELEYVAEVKLYRIRILADYGAIKAGAIIFEGSAAHTKLALADCYDMIVDGASVYDRSPRFDEAGRIKIF